MNVQNQISAPLGLIQQTILSVFQRHTEYSPDEVDFEADFESDLGIDSIILASIQADIYSDLQLDNCAVQAGLANINQLVQLVQRRLTEEGKDIDQLEFPVPATAVQDEGRSPTSDELTDRVLDVYQQHTGYSRSDLSLDADLASDLGVDSVTQGTVLSELPKALGIAAVDFPDGIGTIGQVIEHLRSMDTHPSGCRSISDHRKAKPCEDRAAELNEDSPQSAELLAFIEQLKVQSKEVIDDCMLEQQPRELSFSANGISRKALNDIYEQLRSTHGIPETIRLSDCDTEEKLRRYMDVIQHNGLQTVKASVNGYDRQKEFSSSTDGDARSMKDFVDLADRDLFHKAREFRRFYLKKKQSQLYWYGMPLESQCRNRAVIYDEITGKRREFLMFASNNYLGLANHPDVIDAIVDAAKKFGATNTGCRLIGGSNVLHKELERRLADLKQREDCIVYPSGYSANLGCISALAGRRDLVFTDNINHMSIQDGCKLSGAQRKIYAHSMDSLENTLRKHADHDGGRLIVTDGVFSMHGDIVDLPRLLALAEIYGARVLVDDAHSTGVLGKTGAGTAEYFGLKGKVDLELGTLSKALGGVGGFVCGDEEVIEYLRFYSNSYVFAATIPAPVAAGVIASIDVMLREPQRLQQLWSNIRYLKERLLEADFDLERSNSAIIPVVVGDDKTTLEFGRAVRARGMYCQTVVYPGVAVGDARLRISLSSEHTTEDLDLAAQILVDAAREIGLPSYA